MVLASYGQNPQTGENLPPKVEHFSTTSNGDILLKIVNDLSRETHRNVYVPLCSFREDLPPGKKGGEADISTVFGLVADLDDDQAHKWPERLPFQPTYVLETSKDRFQAGYIFTDGVAPDAAKPVAVMLQEYSGCDFGTKDLSHVWRIPGTLNYPNKKKVDAGRSPEPQFVTFAKPIGDSVDFEELKNILEQWHSQKIERQRKSQEKHQKPKNGTKPFQFDGDINHLPVKPGTKDFILSGAPVGQRSEAIQTVLNALVYSNLDDGQIFSIFNSYPIGEKYSGQKSPVQWLQPQIKKARSYVTEKATAERTTGKETIQEPWGDIVSIEDREPSKFDPSSFPGVVGEMARAISEETETPFEMSAGLILSVLATACQGRFMIEVKEGYREPLNLWVVVALEPANRKSSTLTACTRPLTRWENEKRITMEPEISHAKVVRSLQESRLKSLRAKYGKAKPGKLDEIQEEIFTLENELEPIPVAPQIWSQDVTPEHLGTLMGINNERMTVLSAEGGIFDILGGRYSNGIPNLDLFLQGHAGDPVRVDRGSREPVNLENPCLSLGLSPQPDVLKGMASKPGFRGRGLLARPLYLLPQSNLGYRTLDTVPIPKDLDSQYERVVHSLLDITSPENERGESCPYILKLSHGAYKEWSAFYHVTEEGLRDGGQFEFIRGWAGKLPGAAARIAGLLHCAENIDQPWTKQVSLETMQSALDIAAVFSNHALIAFDLMGADEGMDKARKVWCWIRRKGFSSFKKRDCFDALKGTFPRMADIEDPVKILTERNYIRPQIKETGGRPSIICHVNPIFMKEG
ncbi:DUF3987 domain-containing protein [Desulforapulum autotrophicum]